MQKWHETIALFDIQNRLKGLLTKFVAIVKGPTTCFASGELKPRLTFGKNSFPQFEHDTATKKGTA